MQPIERMLLINYRFWWHRIRASILYVCEVRSVEYELESAVECEFKKFYFYLHNFLFARQTLTYYFMSHNNYISVDLFAMHARVRFSGTFVL